MIKKMSSETAEFWILKKVIECRSDIKLWRVKSNTLSKQFADEVNEIEKYLAEKAERLKELRNGW